jgi:hypothetical protein
LSFFSIGIDDLLAQHIAHLFIRDPVILFEEKIHLDDTKAADHFEVKLFLIKFILIILIFIEY